MNRKILIYSIIVLLIDQITKYVVQIFETNMVLIKNIFGIIYSENTGASFSLLEGKTPLIIVVTIVMIFLVYNMMFSFENNRTNNIIFGIIFGGIFGNFIDRIIFGYVRDFISIGKFPIFNVADTAIVIGIIMLGIITLKGDVKNGNKGRVRKQNKN